MKSTLRFFVLLIFIIALGLFIYWLWERQPKDEKSPNIYSPEIIKEESQKQTEIQNIIAIPKDGEILDSQNIKLKGKTTPANLIVVLSNSDQKVKEADSAGNFEIETFVSTDLNLIKVIAYDANLNEKSLTNLAYFVKEKNEKIDADTVSAGSVKNIFDKLITITTANGEKNIRQETSTQFKTPTSSVKINLSPPKTAEGEIRIGDFAIVLGKKAKEEIIASSIELIRENKPQIIHEASTVTIITQTKQNPASNKQKIFSAKNLKDNNLLELILDKDSQIQRGQVLADEKLITKDKKAIVIYHKENQSASRQESTLIVDLIYLLP